VKRDGVRVRRRSVLASLLLVLFPAVALKAAASALDLTIARKYKSDKCTSGYLAINGKITAYTLELPWQGNAPLISAIPDGTYPGFLRYDHADKWRIELNNVPGPRTHIQIHTGNTTDDSEGCILVGTKLGADLCTVQNSKEAYDDLRVAFYGSANPVATPDKTIRVVVES
jgi:hypothetical protein